ncbi:MAG: glycosyltransferase family 4 protein [Firmicutes bacterium]|nr:glycosyltransferase family 4 protein [Bacillota bacterium]MCL5012615.1 glycosyltransferase family 4 protein [Bacillota bacterium]
MKKLVWAFGRHLNRTTENLGLVMTKEYQYDLIPFSMEISRLRRIPAMVASFHVVNGKVRAFSSIHPWTKRQVHLPLDLEGLPVMIVMGSHIMGSGPHFFYQDLDVGSIIRDRLNGKRTFMYDDVPMSLLQKMYDRQLWEYERAQAVFTMSEWVRRSIAGTGVIAENRVHTVHSAPNLPVSFDSNPYSPRNLEARTLVFVGRDFVRKGGEVLLEAWPQVLRSVPLAKLKIIGPDPTTVPNDYPSVQVLGPLAVNDLIQQMRSSTGLVIPSLWEPYGIAFLEAMSMGLPVIGTNHMAMPEFIVEGSGYLPPAYNVKKLTDAMVGLLMRTDETWEMSQIAFRHAQDYKWSKVASKMDKIIAPVIST